MTKNFLHSGCLGDIVYSLPAVIQLCKQHHCRAKMFIKSRFPGGATAQQHQTLSRLLLSQSYVDSVVEYPSTPCFSYAAGIQMERNGSFSLL